MLYHSGFNSESWHSLSNELIVHWTTLAWILTQPLSKPHQCLVRDCWKGNVFRVICLGMLHIRESHQRHVYWIHNLLSTMYGRTSLELHMLKSFKVLVIPYLRLHKIRLVIQRIIVSANTCNVIFVTSFLWRSNSYVITMMLHAAHKITKSVTKFWIRMTPINLFSGNNSGYWGE